MEQSASASPLAQFDKIIIGIDPGTNVMGYGILGVKAKKPLLVALGVIKLSKFESHYLRLSRIYSRVLQLVEQYLPDEMAIEAPFSAKTCSLCLNWGVHRGLRLQQLLLAMFPSTNTNPVK